MLTLCSCQYDCQVGLFLSFTHKVLTKAVGVDACFTGVGIGQPICDHVPWAGLARCCRKAVHSACCSIRVDWTGDASEHVSALCSHAHASLNNCSEQTTRRQQQQQLERSTADWWLVVAYMQHAVVRNYSCQPC